MYIETCGIRSKLRKWRDGRTAGGVRISRGALYQILRNRLYIGEIAHRGEIHKGNHEPIVEREMWNAAQQKLEEQATRPRQCRSRVGKINGSPRQELDQAAALTGRARSDISGTASSARSKAMLAGIIFDSSGNRMSPSHSKKSGRRYCYYVSAPLIRGRRAQAAAGIRVPASDVEALVVSELASLLRDELWLHATFGAGLDVNSTGLLFAAGKTVANAILDGVLEGPKAPPPPDRQGRQTTGVKPHPCTLVVRVEVGVRKIGLLLDGPGLALALEEKTPNLTITLSDPNQLRRIIPAHTLRCGKQVRLVVGKIDTETCEPDPHLIALVATARRWFEELRSGHRNSLAEIAGAEGLDQAEVSRSITLAFLSPAIVEMIIRGEQPHELTVEKLRAARPLATSWEKQRLAIPLR